jgi:hypothetical protein
MFALATGVGKTRLMGAFITYLFKAEGIRHFFVLAPNLTIYNKLIMVHQLPMSSGISTLRRAAGDHHRRQLRERTGGSGQDALWYR